MKVTRPVQIEHLVFTPGARHDPLRASAAGATRTKAASASSRSRFSNARSRPPGRPGGGGGRRGGQGGGGGGREGGAFPPPRVPVHEAVGGNAAEALEP